MSKIEEKEVKVKETKAKSKKELILESKMPQWQKDQMLIEIGELKLAKEDGVEFLVYAKLKKLSTALTKAMLASSKVKSIRLASLEEWDKILKEF